MCASSPRLGGRCVRPLCQAPWCAEHHPLVTGVCADGSPRCVGAGDLANTRPLSASRSSARAGAQPSRVSAETPRMGRVSSGTALPVTERQSVQVARVPLPPRTQRCLHLFLGAGPGEPRGAKRTPAGAQAVLARWAEGAEVGGPGLLARAGSHQRPCQSVLMWLPLEDSPLRRGRLHSVSLPWPPPKPQDLLPPS